MTNIFANKKAVKDEKVEEDRLGGGGVLETDIYPAKIKYAYIGKAANSNARNVTLGLEINKMSITKQIWVTNKDGEITYTDRKTKKEHNLPGYNQINSLCMLLTSTELGNMDVEEKTLNLYDYESKKEIPQTVNCLIDLHGLDLQVAVQKQIVDKTEKNDQTGDYEPNGETREVNEFVKFFPEDKLVTISEIAHFVKSLGGDFDEVVADGDLQKAIDKMEDGDFATAWLEKNRGETWNRAKGSKSEGKSFKKSGDNSGSSQKKSSVFDD